MFNTPKPPPPPVPSNLYHGNQQQTLGGAVPHPHTMITPNMVGGVIPSQVTPGAWQGSPTVNVLSAMPPVDGMSPAEVENALLKLALDPDKEGVLTLMRSMVWNNLNTGDQQTINKLREDNQRLTSEVYMQQEKVRKLEALVATLHATVEQMKNQLPPLYSTQRLVSVDPYRAPTSTNMIAPTFDITDWQIEMNRVLERIEALKK